jgi:hypothetical protein
VALADCGVKLSNSIAGKLSMLVDPATSQAATFINEVLQWMQERMSGGMQHGTGFFEIHN